MTAHFSLIPASSHRVQREQFFVLGLPAFPRDEQKSVHLARRVFPNHIGRVAQGDQGLDSLGDFVSRTAVDWATTGSPAAPFSKGPKTCPGMLSRTTVSTICF